MPLLALVPVAAAIVSVWQPEAPRPTLNVGDPAPALSIAKWVKGEPVEKFQAGKPYVVEFWATWCGPCRAAMPHLTDLQKQYKDKGVTIIGVSIMEENGLADVEPFVAKMGDSMKYTVAFDKEGLTNAAWMDASGSDGIPTSFIVDQRGKIAWIGHPSGGLDVVLRRVVDNQWDIERFKANRAKEEAINNAYETKDFDKAMTIIDELLKADPELFSTYAGAKFGILIEFKQDVKAALAFAREAVEKYLKDDAQSLNMIAWTILDHENVAERDLPFATKVALRAVEVSKGKDAAILDTLARAYFDGGDRAKAIEIQTKAVELEKDEESKADLQATLERYKNAKP